MPMRTFKVQSEDTIVRINVDLQADSSAQDSFASVQAAVAEALGVANHVSGFVLKYADDEGDMCTLTEMSWDDLMALVPTGVIRLQAFPKAVDTQPAASSSQANSSPQVASDTQEQVPQVSGMDCDEEQAAPSTADGPNPADTNVPNPPWMEMGVQFLPMWLPMVAAELQQEEKQNGLNREGAESREKFLPICERLLARLDELAETQKLKPALQAYISGDDVEHLGDFLASFLQALVPAVNDGRLVIVQSIVRDLMSSCISIMRASDKSCFPNATHEDPESTIPVGNAGAPGGGGPDLGALFGQLFAGKGMGKGYPSSAGDACSGGVPDLSSMMGGLLGGKGAPGQAGPGAGMPDLGSMMGGLLGGKGAPGQAGPGAGMPDIGSMMGGLLGGKGAPGQTNPGAGLDVMGLLGNMMAAKGAGKGAGAPQMDPAQAIGGVLGSLFGKGKGKGAPFGGCTMDTGCPENDAANPGGDIQSNGQEVQDLIDMGLVTDRQVASDLLQMHNGDLASVVAMLTAE